MRANTYMNLNAQDLAAAIIAREEALLNVDVATLSFEEQCHWAAHHSPFYHPLASMKAGPDRNTLLPELRRRADAGEAKAAYYLAILDPALTSSSPHKRELLERAMALGSEEAHVCYADLLQNEDRQGAHTLLEGVLARVEAGAAIEQKRLFDAYCILACVAKPAETRRRYGELSDALAMKFLAAGEYHPLTHMIAKREPPIRERRAFFQTVEFLVLSHLEEKWGRCVGDKLGTMLLCGTGCEPDHERAKRLYLDAYFRKEVKAAYLRKFLDIEEGDSLAEVEAGLRREADGGDIRAYRDLILLAVLQKDTEAAARVCTEAIEKHQNELLGILHAAYAKLAILSRGPAFTTEQYSELKRSVSRAVYLGLAPHLTTLEGIRIVSADELFAPGFDTYATMRTVFIDFQEENKPLGALPFLFSVQVNLNKSGDSGSVDAVLTGTLPDGDATDAKLSALFGKEYAHLSWMVDEEGGIVLEQPFTVQPGDQEDLKEKVAACLARLCEPDFLARLETLAPDICRP